MTKREIKDMTDEDLVAQLEDCISSAISGFVIKPNIKTVRLRLINELLREVLSRGKVKG